MAIDTRQQPGAPPPLLAAPSPASNASELPCVRSTRAEAADYVAKYDQMRKFCAQRLREKFFSDQTPEGQEYYESQVRIGEFVVHESSEDPLDRFITGLGRVEDAQAPACVSRSARSAEVSRSMNRLKSEARKK